MSDHLDPAEDPVEQFLAHLRLLAEQRARRETWRWSSAEELLLATAGAPVVCDRLTLPDRVAPGPLKECFYNAFMATLSDSGLTYAEGMAYAGYFPVPHAWCVDFATGQIVDPTWSNLSYDGPFIYLGVSFSRAFMGKALDVANTPSIFEDDWQRRMRTLRCGLVVDTSGVVIDWGQAPDAAT